MLTINIQYTLSLPFAEQEDPSVSRPRIYGYTRRQLNLTNWYPFVVPYINGEWVLHEPWYYGEHLVYDSADYEVNLKFADPATAPIVAASGVPEQQEGFTRYTITSARTFALAASREFQVSSLQVGDVTVSSYYFPFSECGRASRITSQRRGIAECIAIAMEHIRIKRFRWSWVTSTTAWNIPHSFISAAIFTVSTMKHPPITSPLLLCMKRHINGGSIRLATIKPSSPGWTNHCAHILNAYITRISIQT